MKSSFSKLWIHIDGLTAWACSRLEASSTCSRKTESVSALATPRFPFSMSHWLDCFEFRKGGVQQRNRLGTIWCQLWPFWPQNRLGSQMILNSWTQARNMDCTCGTTSFSQWHDLKSKISVEEPNTRSWIFFIFRFEQASIRPTFWSQSPARRSFFVGDESFFFKPHPSFILHVLATIKDLNSCECHDFHPNMDKRMNAKSFCVYFHFSLKPLALTRE